MSTRKLSMLFATAFTLAYSGTKATEDPMPRTSTSFLEIENNTIYYGMNKVYPDQVQMKLIKKYLKELKSNPDTYIKVTSHTDDVGDWEVNLNVSKKRALAIADYLSRHGIPQDRIVLDWLGEDMPIYFSAEEKHKNRRTNIRIIKKVKTTSPRIHISHTARNNAKKNIATNKQSITTIVKKEVVATQPSIVSKRKVELAKPSTSIPTKTKTVTASTETSREWRKVVKEKNEVQATRKVVTKITDNRTIHTTTKNEDLVSKGAKSVVNKSILFINESTNEPIQVEVDITTLTGKVSVSTSSKGELKIDINNLEKNKIDVFAYGYFFKSTTLDEGTGQQVIKLQPTNNGEKVKLENLQFVPGKALLMAQSNAELDRLYLSLMMSPKRKIEIGGHINVPNKTVEEITAAQMQLSVDRAKSVYDFLINRGISKKRLTYKGYGNSEMVFPKAATDQEKSKNRRVEIKITE